MKEQNPLGKQLSPLIFFIVLVIVLTLIIRGSRLPEKPEDTATAGSNVEMRLSPFSYQQNVRNPAVSRKDLNLPDPEMVISSATRDVSAGQYERAEDQLRTALVFYPNDGRLLSMLGTVLYIQKKYSDSEGIFRMMTMLNPDDMGAYTNLGTVLAEQKRYKEAIVSVKKVYLKEPDSPIAALNLSSMYSLNGDTAEALEYFRKAYEKLGENILPLSYNPNFDNIRREKVFRDIVKEAKDRKAAGDKRKQP